MRSILRVLVPGAVLLALACAPGPPGPKPSVWPTPQAIRFSILAVGDTGRAPRLSHRFHRQLAVGLGLAAEDRRHPVDALLLLGDNFYWRGLEQGELVARLKQNVVRPYCRFVALSGPRSNEVRDACPLSAVERRPVPIHAVLGNHDYKAPESPRLQREVLPDFVPNWRVPDGLAEVAEFPAGVSLVLLQSVELRERADAAPLRAALARSRGPWRILVAHHPVAAAYDGPEGTPHAPEPYRSLVLRAIRDAGVPVQLALGGDEHNLQVIEMETSALPVQVVSGSGSRVRKLRTSNPRLRFAVARPGFVRVDLVEGATGQELVLSVFTTGSVPLFAVDPPELVARWALGRDGALRDVLAGTARDRASR